MSCFSLNVFPILVPPLRDRREDIGLLAEVFLRRFSRKMKRAIAPLTQDCVKRLREYEWPAMCANWSVLTSSAHSSKRSGAFRAPPARRGFWDLLPPRLLPG